MRKALDHLRSGDWLTRERVRLVAVAILFAATLGLVFVLATADGNRDSRGRPVGTDFSNVYAAGTYVLEGRPSAPFDPALQHAREQALFGAATPFYGWHYPPFFLLVAAALATLPYLLALAAWQGVTLGLYLWSVRALLRRCGAPTDPLWLLLAVAFPAVFINLGHGHNGFLTAALLGFALALLDRRPWLAGALLGLLAYKPQFGLLLPLVLLVSGRMRVVAGATATLAGLVIVVTALFGTETWSAFLASARFTREVVLESGDTGWHKIQSVFAWVRMWGGGVSCAYAAQAAVAGAVALTLVLLWRRPAPFPLQAAALAIGTILATPYSLDYDLMVLAPAIACLAAHGRAHGFAPGEKTALALLWIMPLLARSLAQLTLLPLGVIAMLVAFGLVLRRAGVLDLSAHWWLPRPRT